jgi:hypothetical protein
MSNDVTTPSDRDRYALAQAASHGYGAGQVEAGRLIEGWDADEALRQANLILENLDVAQAYAERPTVPFDDYENGVRADPDLARTLTPNRLAALRTVFTAGFDIGFRAALVERCDRVRQEQRAQLV